MMKLKKSKIDIEKKKKLKKKKWKIKQNTIIVNSILWMWL
jgi:hypothetical protein